MLEDTTRINLLYDFYGNLLTRKQRECLELYYQHDLSLAEIADNSGISRQGVHDLIKRAVRTLEKAEKQLGLVERFAAQEKVLRRLRDILSRDDIEPGDRSEALAIVEKLLD
ncbi:MAG: YlxM family DNA-binding protein [Bacillota bacterium]|nr:YlxM family DNA-binding protein [Bacillota bacterium]MDW7684445.1 YlxM family DNA-binding protein [Bacillota bacterium]